MKRARIWLTSPLLTLALACGAGGGGDDTPVADLDPVGNGGTGGTSGDVSAAGDDGVGPADTPGPAPTNPTAQCPSSLPGEPVYGIRDRGGGRVFAAA